MSHRVAWTEEDAEALRFLWWSEWVDEPPRDHNMTVHLLSKADSPWIAACALQRTAIDNQTEFSKEVCDIVTKNFCVYDCLFSVPTTERAIKSFLQLIQLLKKSNFRLTKFVSSSKEVLATAPAKERTVKNLDLDKFLIERAFGLQWNTETDSFGVNESLPHKQLNEDTRRGCLSTISSTFDPVGMFGPVPLPAKGVMQKTRQLKLHWDTSYQNTRWKAWRIGRKSSCSLVELSSLVVKILVAVQPADHFNSTISVMLHNMGTELYHIWGRKLKTELWLVPLS